MTGKTISPPPGGNLLEYAYPTDLLQGRVILVTGATDGIGRSVAIHAASLGASIVVHGRNRGKLESVHDEIVAIGTAPRPSIAQLDLLAADAPACQSLAESIESEFGRLDGIVHNAGILGQRLAIEQYDLPDWHKVMHVNLTAPFILTRVLFPLLRRSDDPTVVFTSSSVGRVGKPFWGAYAVSKFGVEGLSQVIASENEHSVLRCNCINPGPVRTGMRLQAYPAEDRDRLLTPTDLLPAYAYLLGPDSRGVTGQSFDLQ